MNIRRLIRGLRQTKYTLRRPLNGVYNHFESISNMGEGFAGTEWSQESLTYSKYAIGIDAQSFIPYSVGGEHALLPTLVALHPQARILDFGGATGFAYHAVMAATGISPDYTIVETQAICETGKTLFPKARFVTEIPASNFDIAVLGSVLQCISDYKGLLKRIADTQPRFILLTKTPAGDCPTYATCQVNLSGRRHGHWVFNARELADFIESLGFILIMKSAVEGEVNQDNFEPKYRFKQHCNMLFERR